MASSSIRPMLAIRSVGISYIKPQTHTPLLPFLAPCIATRHASGRPSGKGGKKKDSAAGKKKKPRANFIRRDMKLADQFALCDAMRYIRAFEVGQSGTVPKYELAISLRTLKSGPVIRNRLRLPHAVNTSQRVAVICPPDSRAAAEAIKAGATVVGEETIFDAVKDGRIEFDRCLCHADSQEKLAKSGIARILGPRQLMPSPKTGTVVKDVATAMRNMIGATEYREKMGVIRLAVGQLRYTPEELQANIKALMEKLKADVAEISERVSKEIHEVVLSSTNAPGFPLSGEFRGLKSLNTKELSVL